MIDISKEWLQTAKELYDSPEAKAKWCSYCGCEGGCNLCRYNEIEYTFNWCDYFTNCPYTSADIKVGSYECVHDCEYCAGNTIIDDINKNLKTCDYQKYFIEGKGKVICLKQWK